MKMQMYNAYYVEMNCIGDYADFVVYDRTTPVKLSDPCTSSWMVPGSWNNRDEFGRKKA